VRFFDGITEAGGRPCCSVYLPTFQTPVSTNLVYSSLAWVIECLAPILTEQVEATKLLDDIFQSHVGLG